MLEKILVPLDGSDLSARMLAPVARLARETGANVRAVRVLDGFAADQAMLRGDDPHAAAAAELERALAPLEKAGIHTNFDTYVGDAAARILDDIDTHKPSLVAMATHGRSGADEWVRGSVAERVLRRSPVPVFLANPRSMEKEISIESILVPLDGSEMSAAVLPLVADFARVHRAKVTLLHVLDGTLVNTTEAEARAHMEPFVKKLEGIDVKVLIQKGSAGQAILAAARKNKAGLIAMTTHGRSGVSRWVFGSTAEHVLHQCFAPLLLVRTSGHAEGVPGTISQSVAQVL
jgi:nucleotide-binding universal stress UspA family protein